MNDIRIIVLTFFCFCCLTAAGITIPKGQSVYLQKANDPEAIYFTSDNFNIKADGKMDVSDALQKAVNQVKRQYNFGIVFIPEGIYKISKAIYVPAAVRLIGYGKNRPLIVLGKNSPGYQSEVAEDKGKANYMFWFTGGLVEQDQPIRDAGAGTFYSAISNIDLKIEDGNPYAVAIRTHFAQHSFVSNVDIQIGKGKAGIFDVGNEMENVRFFGGDYGIYTTKTSPGWQMMMVNTFFEGQRQAAIRSREGGLTIVRLTAKNVPAVIDIEPDYSDKIYMEDCVFESIKHAGIIVSNEQNQTNQVSLRNIACQDVPVLVQYRKSNTQTLGKGMTYLVKTFLHGLCMNDMASEPEMKTTTNIESLKTLPVASKNDIPSLPDMNSWVNIRDLGAKGDGQTDDTQQFKEAIRTHTTIYVPQGDYVISEPLLLGKDTKLIGLNPISTQLILLESTPAFSGFGAPQPLLTTPRGGENIVSGIGLNTGAYNYRAVACKWMAGESSYMNDVKFIGGHGTMVRGPIQPMQYSQQRQLSISTPRNPVTNIGADKAWDNQYWSLWITEGGGGVFKDIWTASSYSANGVYISNTSTVGKIYAMSVEHHVRNEARFKNVSNWKVYAFQFEIESREGEDCLELELQDCKNILFANLYLFRVIRLVTPFPYAVRTWNCEDIEFFNVHNFAQVKFTIDLTMYDINTAREVRPWEFTYLKIKGDEKRVYPLLENVGKVEQLATGFEFTEGLARDSKGNIYFSEQRMRRIYKWDVEKNTLSMIGDYPWAPLSLAVDTKDNLLVVFRYNPQPGYLINGKQESVPVLPDADGTSFSKWGNTGFATWVYALNPDNPDESIRLLPKVKMGSVAHVAKALYPSNRWRDLHDFDEVSLYVPEECFVAPDGVTILPDCYDLARSSSVLEAMPEHPFYAVDEYERRTVKMDVDTYGKLTNINHFVEQGEFSSVTDKKGNVYVADGHVYVFDKNGILIRKIEVPERPSSLVVGGKNANTLFITARSSIYRIILN
ncbi:hypothetical protein EZS27_007976 [termite gut metagenome]|uniref:Gluconolaconase n=1 Tax=termite gut metagenome TaxID=433724 RepID=A0A5J4SER3_9ZZZZ